MSIDLHTVSILGGTQTARQDRLYVGLLSQQAYDAANGTVTAIAAGTPGAGYTAIPTVAINRPSTGAKATGSGATATAVMKVLTATVAAGGTGGTPGAVTITGVSGTGTKFQATGTINGSGVLTGALVVTVPGAYTAMPSSFTVEAVTGGSLTGATVAISMGVASYTVGGAGTHYPAGAGLTTATLSGGSPTTAAVPGAVTVSPAAGDLVAFDVSLNLPLVYTVTPGLDQDGVVTISNRSQTGFRVTINPRLAANSLAAGAIDLTIAA